MKKIDVDGIKASVDIVDVIGRHIDLEKRGSEWYGLCPFHDDHKKSLQVNEAKQIFKCFACDAGGDVFDFFTEQGMEFKEACEAAAGGTLPDNSLQPQRRQAKRSRPKMHQVVPAPRPAKKSQARHKSFGDPDSVWRYYTADKKIIGYVCRFDHADGSKDILPLTWQKGEKNEGWRFKGFETPRPLYNLPALAERPDAPVLIVEGEKCADAAAKLLPDLVATTWIGGARAIDKTDWSPLHGRRAVYLWPDNDDPGREAVREIGERLKNDVAIIKEIVNPVKAPEHWDVADADWTPKQAREYIKDNVFTLHPKQQPDPPLDEPPHPSDTGQFDHDYEQERPDFVAVENDHFKILGYERTESGGQALRFYAKGPRMTVRYSAGSLNKANLMTLAPVNWWEEMFPKRGDVDMKAATNWLIQTANQVGYFNEKHVRGRGAWVDRGRVVLHAGDMLLVDGNTVELGGLDTRYIYEAQEQIDFKTKDPLPVSESRKIYDLVRKLSWERDINAMLLLGWCAIAPMCGVLPWRPHIWLSGPAGSGKTWIFQNIVSKLVGKIGHSVQGETTEAGIRQLLQHDALPVIFDEAEGEERKSQERMDKIMSLMRASSSDDGGIMVKGTSGGTVQTYHIRSCFAFASINMQVSQQSDRTRVTPLELRKPSNSQEEWQSYQKEFHELATDEYVDRLLARGANNIPLLLENIRTFANAAAAYFGDQRKGDQIGPLLAGGYLFISDKIVDFDRALKWIQELDRKHDTWSEERGLEGTSDERMLLMHILEQMVMVDSYSGTVRRTIGELIDMAIVADPLGESRDMDRNAARQHLARHGVAVNESGIYISQYSDWIRRALRDTAWAKNHHKMLMRIEGATLEEEVKFSSGTRHRAVKIPLRLFE